LDIIEARQTPSVNEESLLLHRVSPYQNCFEPQNNTNIQAEDEDCLVDHQSLEDVLGSIEATHLSDNGKFRSPQHQNELERYIPNHHLATDLVINQYEPSINPLVGFTVVPIPTQDLKTIDAIIKAQNHSRHKNSARMDILPELPSLSLSLVPTTVLQSVFIIQDIDWVDPHDRAPQHLGLTEMYPTVGQLSRTMCLDREQHKAVLLATSNLMKRWIWRASIPERIDELGPSLEQPKPFTLFLGGVAGAGKSCVIKALQCFVLRWKKEDCLQTLAFMNFAANNVDGLTMHNFAGINVNNTLQNLTVQRQLNIAKLDLIIIDEISQTAQHLLGLLERQIKRILQNYQPPNDYDFHGLPVVFAGDWLQLGPVQANKCFQRPKFNNTNEYNTHGYNAYNSITHVVLLKKIHRQRDPVFINFLTNCRFGETTDADLTLLNTRLLNHTHTPSLPTSKYPICPIAVGRNLHRKILNSVCTEEFAKTKSLPIFQIDAVLTKTPVTTNQFNALSQLPDNLTDRTPLRFHAVLGMPIMITDNIYPGYQIVKDTLGHIEGFQWHPDTLFSTETDDTTE
jgi:hypothetical protein